MSDCIHDFPGFGGACVKCGAPDDVWNETRKRADPRKLIQEANELDRVATKGPWYFQCDEGNTYERVCDGPNDDALVIADTFQNTSEHDGPFIARSRTLLVELADALEKALEGNDG